MSREMLEANKSIVDLGLDDAKIDQILNSDNIIAELRKKVDESEIAQEIQDKKTDSDDVKETLNAGSGSNSITDDDLL
jgi:hypothetical protein